jgi:hypothetical protein
MSDIFISYSRRDSAFVRRLDAALKAEGREVWVDWEDIPPTAEWFAEIIQAIDASDAFAFVISPHSVASQTCRRELEQALSQSKRIIPILTCDVDASLVPAAIAKLNWVMLREQDEFQAGLASLRYAFEVDLDWVRAHTRLLVRSAEWDAKGKDPSYLLSGTDLQDAQVRLARAGDRTPAVTQTQVAYVAASQRGMIDRQQKQLRGFYIVSIVYGALQCVLSYFFVFDQISETGLMVLSPLWVLGLVFGISGLTIGRTSLKRAIVVTVGAGAALYLFFMTLWDSL